MDVVGAGHLRCASAFLPDQGPAYGQGKMQELRRQQAIFAERIGIGFHSLKSCGARYQYMYGRAMYVRNPMAVTLWRSLARRRQTDGRARYASCENLCLHH